MRKNRDPWRELHDNIKVIKGEVLYPIVEFILIITCRIIDFFDHLYDHLFDHRGNNENNKKNDL